MKNFLEPPRPFWLDLLLLLVTTSLVGLILTLVSSVLLSNVYFLAGIAFLLIAIVPIFSEMGGNARAGRQARKEGKHPFEVIKENEKSGKYSRGSRITFLFGLSGFLCFALAILTL